MPRPSSPVEERLWRRVREAPDGCWIWLGAVTSAGYGALSVDGRLELAHRVAYRLVVGAIRPGHEIDHACGNTRCVNPHHLEQVTHRENIRRGRFPAHGAYARERGVCKRGHALTTENVYRHPNGSWRCRRCRSETRTTERTGT